MHKRARHRLRIDKTKENAENAKYYLEIAERKHLIQYFGESCSFFNFLFFVETAHILKQKIIIREVS